MKKLVLVFTILASFLVFIFGYQVYSERQYSQIANLSSAVAENNNQSDLLVEFGLARDPDKVMYEIDEFLNAHHYTAFAFYDQKDSDLLQTQYAFVYSKDVLDIYPFFKTKSHKNIDFSKPTDAYYSSDLSDKNAYDYIQFLNDIYYKPYRPVYQVRQLSSFTDFAKEHTFILLIIICDSSGITFSQIKDSPLKKYLRSKDPIDTTGYQLFKPVDISTSVILLSLVSISLLLTIFCEILSRKKEISIRKLQGMSNAYIFKKLYLKTILEMGVMYILATLLSYYFILHSYADIQKVFLMYVGKMACLFLVLLVMVSICSYLIIRYFNSYIALKRSEKYTWAIHASTLLKISAIVIMLPLLCTGSVQGAKALQQRIELYLYSDSLANNLFFESFYPGAISDSKILSLWKEYAQDHGGIYQDFEKIHNDKFAHFLLKDDPEKFKLFDLERDFIEYPFIVVNQNYLKDYKIETIDGDIVDIVHVADHTVLVPEKYKNSDIISFAPDAKKVIVIKNGQKYMNYRPLQAYFDDRFVKDAIVEIRTVIDTGMGYNNDYLLIPYTEESLEEAYDYLKETGMYYQVNLEVTEKEYKIVVTQKEDQCLHFLSSLIVYTLLMVAFVYQNIFLYFYENKQRIALNYLSGKTFFERYAKLLIEELLIYGICFGIGSWILKLDLTFMVLFTLLALTMQGLLIRIMVSRYERKNLVGILKGE